ncbi:MULTISPECIES: hypothetical protein [Thermus]|jgi:hypothetical protein|uniref:Uncharacterized protein n=1 Tax=Thermus brockianus TaxID=56956 RepID=A0A1J0LUC3_THEBO|nr:hypothetical protein [Thermus brockianus]APD09958.1 hypothetical protein A0O31_01871 [Thermus brockianus]BDG16733.1 hypothetical protein TbrSNM41_14670 [Thermus brockianus]
MRPGPWLVLLLAGLLFWTPPTFPEAPPSPSLRALLPYPKAVRERLVALHLRNKASLRLLLGEGAARAYDRLLRLELSNQRAGKHSAFAEPQAALAAAKRWVEAIGQAHRRQRVDLRGLPTAPHHVLPHTREIRAAAGALHIPKGTLAAIVDNEQYGGDKALGLSRSVREAADALAEDLATLQGQAPFSRTLGLAQMSWEDALKQEERLRRFGAWDPARPFPRTEAEARAALEDPYLNLLFTASRLRGYFNAILGLSPGDTRPLEDPWLHYLGPAWHNYPLRAQNLETWEDSFHGFFKGLLYEEVLEGHWHLEGQTLIPERIYGPGTQASPSAYPPRLLP